MESNKDNIFIRINDDGPGFPEDIIELLGEPYIKSKSKKIKKNSGTGLGTFLGKTLLARQGAKLNFQNKGISDGASVEIKWEAKLLVSNA